MAVEKNLRVAINFYKKLCLPVVTWNKKHLSKPVLPIIITLQKFLFVVATVGCLWVVSFQTE